MTDTATNTLTARLADGLHDFTIVDGIAAADNSLPLHVTYRLLVDGVYTPGLYNLNLPWSIIGSRLDATVLRVHAATEHVEHHRFDPETGEHSGGNVGGVHMLCPESPNWADVQVWGAQAVAERRLSDPIDRETERTLFGRWTEIAVQVRSFRTAFADEVAEEPTARH